MGEPVIAADGRAWSVERSSVFAQRKRQCESRAVFNTEKVSDELGSGVSNHATQLKLNIIESGLDNDDALPGVQEPVSPVSSLKVVGSVGFMSDFGRTGRGNPCGSIYIVGEPIQATPPIEQPDSYTHLTLPTILLV